MNIEEKFFKAIAGKVREPDDKFHASDLSFGCLRNSYYKRIFGNEFVTASSLMSFWIGKQLHATQILKSHELFLTWGGLSGTIDDYEEGTLLEKKTTTWKITRPLDLHVRQLEYYALLLAKNNLPLTEAHVLYIDVGKKEIIPFKVDIRDLREIEDEVIEKIKILKQALNDKKPPARVIGWGCMYCPYAMVCFQEAD
jgi:hypothetical protein